MVSGIEYIQGCAAGGHAHIQETGLDLREFIFSIVIWLMLQMHMGIFWCAQQEIP